MSTAEPATLRLIPSVNHRSYSCYNCNHSFHITPAPSTSDSSSSSFRCPRCFHRHLLPHHIISSPPPPPSPPMDSEYTPAPSTFTYHTSDESDSDYDYDSDNSLISFTTPSFYPSTPALKSFVSSLPIKRFPPNSSQSLQSCSICMEDFEIDSNSSVTVNELPCQHYFHRGCVVEWLSRSYTCPLCRYKLPIEPGPEECLDTDQWDEEYDAVLVVDLAVIGEPMTRRLTGDRGMGSGAAVADSSRERRGVSFDAMQDEDGDTLMVNA